MFTELRSALLPAVKLLLAMTLLLGLAYPAATTGIAQLALPGKANGSLIVDGGKVIGSELIGQNFAAPGYFHPRASAAGKGYDASSSAGTNLAPGSKDLRDAIAGRVETARAEGAVGPIPADLVTTSGSGLDPHLSPEAALAQVARVAKARGMTEAEVRALVATQTDQPLFGLLGEPRVNVLLLNRALDAANRQTGAASANPAG